jgi:large subunit ribosomal protein L18
MDQRITLQKKRARRERRRRSVRRTLKGTTDRPRLTVFRSLHHIYAQVIDDTTGRTLAAAGSSAKEVNAEAAGKKKSDVSKLVGALVAKRAIEQNVTKVVFDRNGYKFHGRIKALADAAREAGLQF